MAFRAVRLAAKCHEWVQLQELNKLSSPTSLNSLTLSPGIHIINLRRTYEKLLLAARAIVAVENPADVYAISARPWGQRAVLKYSHHTGATPIAGRFTPGCFTNQIQVCGERGGGGVLW